MRIVFFGASELGYACCEELIQRGQNVVGIFTAPRQFAISYSPDKPVTNILHRDFHGLGEKYGIPIVIVREKMSLYKQELEFFKPDLILVIGWYHMIPKSMRDLAGKGCAGIHASLLPRYRGGAPLVWAMINGERETGVTFFYFDDGVDSGNVISQKSFPILETDTIKHLLDKTAEACKELLRNYVPKIADGTAPSIKQDESKATLFPQRKPEDGRIDWGWSKEKIGNFIRAQTKPYPGAFTIIRDKKIIIWDAEISEP
jgi:methionyl-tRNA formyltransferase